MTTNLTMVPQAAAIPVRDGQVCLVTSRSGKRWLVPKGCMEPGKSTVEIALQEAWEEAGLVGFVGDRPIGFFEYEKVGQRYRVAVYVMHVTEVHAHWPERGWRARCWVSAAQAEVQVANPDLRWLIAQALATADLAATA